MLQNLSRTKVFFLLAVITLLVRLPFFFPDVIDHDESTFILMGQDILDGNLPYVKLWDIKPPLIFFFFAVLISLFGKTIPAIRLGGTLCLFGAACLLYLAGERARNSRTGFIAALLLIIFVTISPSGGCTMSEIVAIVPLTGALLVFLKDRLGTKHFFLAGLLISCACLIRLNLVYMAMMGGILVLYGRFFQTQAATIPRTMAYIAGGIVPLAIFFFPYVFSGETRMFVTSLFYAPLAYSQSQLSMLQAAYEHLVQITEVNYLVENFLLVISFFCGLFYVLLARKSFSSQTRAHISILILFLLGTGLSILKTGAAFDNYLIQILPLVALISGFFLDCLMNTNKRLIFMAITLLFLIHPFYSVVSAYKAVALRAIEGKRLSYGPSYEIAEFLKSENPHNDPVYFMEGHLVYWFINSKPLSSLITHPTNLGREYVLKVIAGPSATVESELEKILAKEPAFIVKPSTVTYLNKHPRAQELLFEKLFMDYVLVKEIDKFLIYKHI